MDFYRELDFPAIPKELLEILQEGAPLIPKKTVPDIGYGGRFYKNDRELTACRYTYGVIYNRDFDRWLAANLPIEPMSKVYQQQHANAGRPSTHIVHADILRSYALNYYVDLGGEGVITSWYRERGKPLIRSKTRGGQQADTGAVDYGDLDILDQMEFQAGRWYLLAVSILHDVDHISTTRNSVSIALASAAGLLA